MKIAVYQLNSRLGAISENSQKIINAATKAKAGGAEILITPELSICGTPPHNLLLIPKFINDCEKFLGEIAQKVLIPTLVGHPWKNDGKIFNALSLVANGKIITTICKNLLVNDNYFNEPTYFESGVNSKTKSNAQIIEVGNLKIFLSLENLNTPALIAEGKFDLIINITNSPYFINKSAQINTTIENIINKLNKPLIYLNCVGGQDDIVFEGGSKIINVDRSVAYQLPIFNEGFQICEFQNSKFISSEKIPPTPTNQAQEIYLALVCALTDYLHKNNIKKVFVGLSGGIDSAIVAVVSVQAVGAENVEFVFMPSEYTSQISLDGATQIAKNLGCRLHHSPINNIFAQCQKSFQPFFVGKGADLTEENLQARIRGLTLMAFANKFGGLVVNTSNRSEGAMGYGTLYGDLVGGYALIKDLYKFQVYDVANYINEFNKKEIIPLMVINRAPSAELRPNQKDSDSIPDYPILDKILQKYFDEGTSAEQLVEQGFDKTLIAKIIQLYKINEYKRRQFPLGLNIAENTAKVCKTPSTHSFSEL